MSGNYVTPRYDRNNMPGIVRHAKTTGVLDVLAHDSGISVVPAPYRPFLGSAESGFHSAPQLGDNVVLLFGPNNRVLAAVSMLSPDNTKKRVMPTLNPGESGQYHKDGRVADLLPNSGGATLYSDPAHSVSLLANTLGFAVTGKIVGGDIQAATAEVSGNETVGGTLGVTGAVTVTGQVNANGGIVIGNMTVGSLQTVSGTVVGGTCSITFPHGLSLTINGVSHVVPLLT